MIPIEHVRSMRTAFEKMAADTGVQEPTVRSFAALQRKLQPGDILVASPKPNRAESKITRGVSNLFAQVSKKFQGDYTHSSVYTGDGNVTEIRIGETASTKPLREALKSLDVKVVRPAVSRGKRNQAIKKLKKMVDEGAQYDPKMLFETAAANFVKLKGKSLKERIEANKIICSNMISRAYSGVKFHKGKDPELIMPSDFLESHKTEHVVTFKNPGRRNR